jgi:hypothetical protein
MIKDSTTIVGLVANHFKMTPQLMFSDVRKKAYNRSKILLFVNAS